MTDAVPAAPSALSPTRAEASPRPPRRRYTTREVLRGVWKLLVGIKDMLALLLLLLFFVMLAGALTARPNPAVVPGAALLLKLDGSIVEQKTDVSPFAALSGSAPTAEFRRSDLVRALNAAASDDRVPAVVLDLDRFTGGGQVALGDVADAVARVRRAGKPVYAYATAYTRPSYLLASAASEVWTSPEGGAMIAGPGGNQLYFRGLLDRLGITPNVYRVGTFKSAVEPFTRSDQSPEAEAAAQAYTNALWGRWQERVRALRPRANFAPIVNDLTGAAAANGNSFALAAKANGLIDHVGSRLAFETEVAKKVGRLNQAEPWNFRRTELDDWVAANPIEETGDPIAVVPLVGNIVDGEAPAGTAGGDTVSQHILDAVADPSVKALVLRVDSGGGSALASEQIRNALRLAREGRKIPVVVSMGNVAASGGYWVTTASDRIVAEPDTITGSIGVFGLLPSFEGSLAKLGIGADGVTTTPLSGQPDLFNGPNEASAATSQAAVEQIYARFTTLVAQNRRMPVERVREIAEGRVWAGGDARQLGLVDRFGGLDVAIEEAARLARLDPNAVYPKYFEETPSPLAELLSSFGKSDSQQARGGVDMLARVGAEQQGMVAAAVAQARRLVTTAGVQAECLECVALSAPAAPLGVAESGWLARLFAFLR